MKAYRTMAVDDLRDIAAVLAWHMPKDSETIPFVYFCSLASELVLSVQASSSP